MESKAFEAYGALYQLVSTVVPRFNPRVFRVDFERAHIRAIELYYPNADIKGCYVHFVRVRN